MIKNFVLDTNVLLHDPEALTRFADNRVIIPIYVIEEIDQFKKESSERGRNARRVARFLDACRQRGNLGVGVPLEGGGVLRVIFSSKPNPAQFLNRQLADNLILGVALEIQQLEPNVETIFITKDTNLRVRADAVGLKAVNYEESSVRIDELYPGACELDVSPDQFAAFYDARSLPLEHHLGAPFDPLRDDAAAVAQRSASRPTPPGTHPLAARDDAPSNAADADDVPAPPPTLYANEYVLLRSSSSRRQTALGRFNAEQGAVTALRVHNNEVWGLRPRNKEQHFALDALLDDNIKLVTLIGKAGTGKTLIALAAGFERSIEGKQFARLLVSRPVFPLGRDIGHLPGTVEEKLNPWMQPIFDNVELLLSLKNLPRRTGKTPADAVRLGLLQIEPLTFIRGRSIPNQYLIVDEAQNLTPHEVKTIITRSGQGTKIVLTGDPYQIDNPYVDSESNGLTYTINRFKGQSIAATVTLFKGERSDLAELASNLL